MDSTVNRLIDEEIARNTDIDPDRVPSIKAALASILPRDANFQFSSRIKPRQVVAALSKARKTRPHLFGKALSDEQEADDAILSRGRPSREANPDAYWRFIRAKERRRGR